MKGTSEERTERGMEAWTARGKEGREEVSGGGIERERVGAWEQGREGNFKGGSIFTNQPTIHKPALALEIGCICHGMDSMHYREPERSRVTI